MEKFKSVAELRKAIQALEAKQKLEAQLLKAQFQDTCEQLRPSNLIKGAFHDLISTRNGNDGFVNSFMGISAGAILKKIITGSSWNPLRMLFGTTMQLLATSMVSKNANVIRSRASRFIQSITHNKEHHT